MKTKLFLSALALGAMMTTFVACDKDEPYVDPDQVIESEVVDSGSAEAVTEMENGTDGTTLSYETWIVVYQVFADGSSSGAVSRASTKAGNKISVTLTNDIVNSKKTMDVADFYMEDGVPSIEYKELGANRHADQRYVTVIDSAAVYTVDRKNFAVEFVLPYQVAVYDDGITKAVMPYHKYSDIRDFGGKLSEAATERIDGKDYEVREYEHTIAVYFNGKECIVKAVATLRKQLVGDYLLSKTVVGKGVELLSYDQEAKTGISKSWIEIEEFWSESGSKKVRKEILLHNGLPEDPARSFLLSLNKQVSLSSLKVEKGEIDVFDAGERSEDGFVITKHSKYFGFIVSSSEDNSNSSTYNLAVTYETAVYSDEYVTCEMPGFSYENAQCRIQQTDEWQNFGNYYSMSVILLSNLTFGEVEYNYSHGGEIRYSVHW